MRRAATATDINRVLRTWLAAYLPYRAKELRSGWFESKTGASVVLPFQKSTMINRSNGSEGEQHTLGTGRGDTKSSCQPIYPVARVEHPIVGWPRVKQR